MSVPGAIFMLWLNDKPGMAVARWYMQVIGYYVCCAAEMLRVLSVRPSVRLAMLRQRYLRSAMYYTREWLALLESSPYAHLV